MRPRAFADCYEHGARDKLQLASGESGCGRMKRESVVLRNSAECRTQQCGVNRSAGLEYGKRKRVAHKMYETKNRSRQ